eukprot:171207_1
MAMPRMPQGFPGMPQMPQGAMPRQSYRMPGQGFTVNTDALEQKYGVDPKRWRCIYPCYLNIKKTIAQGRKISKKYCVEQPHPSDIADVCKYLGLPFYMELNKTHPRDFFNRSRVRVLLKDKDGNFKRDDIVNRYQLLIALGKMIPKLESRKIRLERQKQLMKKRKEMIEAKQQEIKEIENKKKQKKDMKNKKKRGKHTGNTRGRRSKGGRRGKKGRR